MKNQSVNLLLYALLLFTATLPSKAQIQVNRLDSFFNALEEDGKINEYQLGQGELNFFGLKLFEDHHAKEALEVLRLNTLLFPASFNVYDSYAEVLLKTGKKIAAIAMYQKTLNLNPKNDGARKVLEQLKKD